MDVIDLQGEQLEAFAKCINHFTNKVGGKYLIFGAPGGCGKTFVLRRVVSYMKRFNRSIAVIAYTGRAASQLSKDGVEASTCHSLIYKPRFDQYENIVGWDERSTQEILESCRDGIVVDESSMIPEKIHKVLDKLGIQIIYSGDFHQLPPVEPDGSNFNAMVSVPGEVVTLEENRRFGMDTGIGFISSHLRNEDSIPRVKKEGLSYARKNAVLTEKFHIDNRFDVIACGMNKTRKKINNLVRQARGYHSEIPEVGETVVCLRNTLLITGKINNGELFTVEGVIPGHKISTFMLMAEDGKDLITVSVMNDCWNSEQSPTTEGKLGLQMFGFGYCLSVHKIQGSTFNTVLFVDEDVSFFLDRKKFRYTAVTRAAKHLCIAI